MSEIVLSTNNYSFKQFKSVNILDTMNAITGSMSLETIDFYSGNHADWKIKLGKEYTIKIDGQLICTGYLDEIDVEYSKTKHFIIFAGRNKTGDLVDCNYDNTINEWKNETVYAIIQKLCSPYGITVLIGTGGSAAQTKRLESFKIGEGENVVIAIQRACLVAGVMAISTGEGKISLVQAGTENSYDGIELGVNAVSVFGKFSNQNRYSKYVIKGTGYGTDNKQLSDFIAPVGSANDLIITRSRPFVYLAETIVDSGQCLNMAKWERQIRAGQSRKRIYCVNKWVQTNGNVWAKNKKVRVKDGMAGIDKSMLISEVQFLYDSDQGQYTFLTVVDINTYTTNDQVIKSEFD